MAEYWQRGETIDYTNETDEVIEAGDVITFGDRIGVAASRITPGEVGAIHVTGVFAFENPGDAFSMGDPVSWDDGAKAVSNGGANPVGYCISAAEATDKKVMVKLNG